MQNDHKEMKHVQKVTHEGQKDAEINDQEVTNIYNSF